MDFQALADFITIYANKNFHAKSFVSRIEEDFHMNVESIFTQKLKSAGNDVVSLYQQRLSEASDNGSDLSRDNWAEYAESYTAAAQELLGRTLPQILKDVNINIPQSDYIEHAKKQAAATKARFSSVNYSIIQDRKKQKEAASKVSPKSKKIRSLYEGTKMNEKGPSTEPSKVNQPSKKSTSKKSPQAVRNTVINYPMVVNNGTFGNAVTRIIGAGSSNQYRGDNANQEENSSDTPSTAVIPQGYDMRNLYATFYMMYSAAQNRTRLYGSRRLGLPSYGNPALLTGGRTIPLLSNRASGKYGTTSNIYDTSVKDYLDSEARRKRQAEALGKLGRHIESGDTIQLGTTFQQGEKNAKKKQERQEFLNNLLTGIRKIMGKNPLWDLVRWGFLLLGKNHPILATIGLTLPLLVGPILGIVNLIKGFSKLTQFLKGGKSKVAGITLPGTIAYSRGVAAAALHSARGVKGPLRGPAIAAARAFTGTIKSGNAVLGFLGKNATKLAGPLSGLLSFGINKASGQSTGEAASRAIGSTALGALGAFIAGPIGAVIGGLLGDWIGGKLFSFLNRNNDKQTQKLDEIVENTSWLDRLVGWIRDKFHLGDDSGKDVSKYGQGTPVITPEQQKRNDEYKTLSTIHALKAKGMSDSDIRKKFPDLISDGDIATYGTFVRQARQQYAHNMLKKGGAAVEELRKKGASDDYIRNTFEHTKGADDYVSQLIKQKGNQVGGYNLSAALKNHAVTSAFGWRVHPGGTGSASDGKRHFHTGIDIAYKQGEAIKAYTSGKVISVGDAKDGYGNVVKIMDNEGRVHQYSHGSKFGKYKVGDQVNAGDVIMYAGSTGFATGPHNHYMVTKNGRYIDPLTGTVSTMKAQLTSTQKAAATETTTATATSNATAVNGLRQSFTDRIYGKDNALRKANEIIFTATDVTGSLGVWGIMQRNNVGR